MTYFRPLPHAAAWRHGGDREGFEAAFFETDAGGVRLQGHTAAAEEGQVWVVRYEIRVDPNWDTVTARTWAFSSTGEREAMVDRDSSGRWRVNGSPRPDLDGCLDVDLESSACTNTLPVHRMQLGVGDQAEAPAAYVRAPDLRVERLEQRYVRVADDDDLRQRYDYRAPAFNFECRLVFDDSGLILDYPEIASRVQ